MTERASRSLLFAEVAVLLAPATVMVGAIIWLSYPAYPPPDVQPLALAFDLSMIAVVLGLISAWRLGIAYVAGGCDALRQTSTAWSVLLALGALAAIAGATVAGEHMLHPETARNFVGFALLSPALPLALIAVHLLWIRRHARTRA